MPDGIYAQLSEQARRQYNLVSTRGESYLELLRPAYESFLAATGRLDTVLSGMQAKPTASELASASDAVALLESAFNGIALVMQRFVEMDAQAARDAPPVSQMGVEAQNKASEAVDDEFELALNNVLYRAELAVAGDLAAQALDGVVTT